MDAPNTIRKLPVIRTRHFTLRPFRRSDASDIAARLNDRMIAKNLLSVPHPYSIEDAHDWLRFVRNAARRRHVTWINFAIEIDGGVVGGIGVSRISGHKAEIGYWLARSHWGKGLMTRIVAEIVKFCFRELGLRRVYAHVFTFNRASARVLEKNGFKLEGKLIKAVQKGNKLIDEFCYARTR